MKERLLDHFERYWLKPQSIPIALAISAFFFWGSAGAINDLEGITLSAKSYCIIAAVWLLVWAIYCVVCIKEYRLPRAPKDCLAVLFCVEAESEKLFKIAKKKLVDNFEASLLPNSKIRFRAFCVSQSRVRKFDLKCEEGALRLLEKTRCVLLVTVRYISDDPDNAENFKLSVHYGIRHPRFEKNALRILTHDMAQLAAPLRNQHFEKKYAIDAFDFTTQALVFGCQYLVGFVALLTGNGEYAAVLFQQARQTVLRNDGNYFDVESFLQFVDDRLYASYNQAATNFLRNFQDSHTLAYLRQMDEALENANKIHANTYAYNLGKAYLLVILNQDGVAARKCIDQCKEINQNHLWRYSDAFLCAYAGRNAGFVISKYNKAFKTPYDNWLELADYIEFVLDREPNKKSLHLAAGLIYTKIEDCKLARQHLAIYLSLVSRIDCRDREKVERLMESQKCDHLCNNNCATCANTGDI